MINKTLVENVRDEESLIALLSIPEDRGGLGWPVDSEFAFDEIAEIAQGVKGDGKVRVSRLVPAGAAGERLIILAEFERPFLRRDLRELLRSLRSYARQSGKFPDHTGLGDTIFVVAAPGFKDVRFVLFEERQSGQPKLRSFGWKQSFVGRTVLTHNLPKLVWEKRLTWADAWSVEALTKEFFREISDRFYDTVDVVRHKFQSEDAARLVVQTLFNRLLFLRFVEEKGWLDYNGEVHYLQALWQASQQDKNPLWPTRLCALFDALNLPTSDQVHSVARPLIGNVHYLNGGLFEEKLDPTLPFPSKVFEALIGAEGLFYRYNFMAEESTPLDIEIAIDPEMLGKIFEQLTISTRRHDTGSYYTPREIVQFMCREALVGYLGNKGLVAEKARTLVYELNDCELTNQEGTLAFYALKEIKVVDPACGSGAYLLGMLQELYALFEKLRRDDRKFSEIPAKEAHDRKLWIIENNLYGVDLQAFATNTAMLRLWLTLLVEDTGASPRPLPNLEYKIETGDSLLGPAPSQPIDWSKQKAGEQDGLDMWEKDKTIRALREFRAEYQNSHGNEKVEKKKQFEAKLAELREKITGDHKKDPAKFDWRVEFFDVFLEDPAIREPGFDAVLANPPYVRKEDIPEQAKPILLRNFKGAISGRSDLYCSFYARGLQLLSVGGMHVYVCSSAWLDASYGAHLQEYLLNHSHVRLIIDSAVEKQFTTANVNTIISVVEKRPSKSSDVTDFVLLLNDFESALAKASSRRVRRLDQESLLALGTSGGSYIGGKWGGAILRGPDVYNLILGMPEKLVALGDFCEVVGYIHDNNTGPTFPMARVLWSMKDANSLLVRPDSQGVISVGVSHAGNSAMFAPVLFARTFGTRHAVFYCEGPVLGKEFYRILPKLGTDTHAVAAQLNSTFAILQRELLGIRGLGGGALKFAADDVKRFQLVKLSDSTNLVSAFVKMTERSVLPIEEELRQEDRLELDGILFDELGLVEQDREKIYEAVWQLIRDRENRSRSTSRGRG